MELENKVLSREIQTMFYESGKTLGTAESCTGGRIAEAIIAVPGASEYFKGSIVSYTNEVKENLLGVDHQLLEEKITPSLPPASPDRVVARVRYPWAPSISVLALPTTCAPSCSQRTRGATRTSPMPPTRPSSRSSSSSRKKSNSPSMRDDFFY